MPRVILTPKEKKDRANKEAADLQARRYHQEKNPKLEAWGLEIAQGFKGEDVNRHELRQFERKLGLFHGYIENALRYKLGYSLYEDKNVFPVNHPARWVLTRRAVCPKCGEVIFGYRKEEQ